MTRNWSGCCSRRRRRKPQAEGRQAAKPQPDFAQIHQELKANKSVTLQLLWQEFAEQHPDGAHYSWFCQQYRDWARYLDVVCARITGPARRPSSISR